MKPSGWLAGARRVDSPNYDARPPGCKPELIVIHAISLPPGEFGGRCIEAFFTNTLDAGAHPYFGEIAELCVSAHFLIRRNGELIQFVSCDMRAWHAGVSIYQDRDNCNDFSIGIELEGCDEVAFKTIQYVRLAALIDVLIRTYPTLSRERIAGHSDIAAGRKTDPGPCFDWRYLDELCAKQ